MFLLASYSKKEFVLRYGRDIPVGIVMQLVKRDLRLFVIFLGALLGYPYYALVAVGLLSHFGIARLGVWRLALTSLVMPKSRARGASTGDDQRHLGRVESASDLPP